MTYDEDGHEAGQRGVPVAAGRGRGLPHQHAVENEVSQAQLDAPCGRDRDAAVRVEIAARQPAALQTPTRL